MENQLPRWHQFWLPLPRQRVSQWLSTAHGTFYKCSTGAGTSERLLVIYRINPNSSAFGMHKALCDMVLSLLSFVLCHVKLSHHSPAALRVPSLNTLVSTFARDISTLLSAWKTSLSSNLKSYLLGEAFPDSSKPTWRVKSCVEAILFSILIGCSEINDWDLTSSIDYCHFTVLNAVPNAEHALRKVVLGENYLI